MCVPFLGPHGKPALALSAHQWLRFNLAHTGDFALCAVCREREVGVDVELTTGSRVAATSMAYSVRQLYSSAERRFLEQGLSQRGDALWWGNFLALWTCKEALGKARGTGLIPPIPSLDDLLGDGEDLPVSESSALPDAWRQRETASTWWAMRIEPFIHTVGALAVETLEGDAETEIQVAWFDLPHLSET